KIPILLFADDSFLISKTPMGLQILVNRFNLFCLNYGLELNFKKTKLMVFRPGSRKKCSISLDGDPLDKVSSIDYLGVRLTDKLHWEEQISKSAGLLQHLYCAFIGVRRLKLYLQQSRS
ncbi:hypothetical protein NDU88_007319, partial [Pleurodeles waltl]